MGWAGLAVDFQIGKDFRYIGTPFDDIGKDSRYTGMGSFSNLAAGEVYQIEVQAISSAGPSDFSAAGSLMAV